MNDSAAIIIHLVRHGRVASHRGNIPITEEGHAEVEVAGRRLAQDVQPGEEVHFLCTSTLRSQQTAATLHSTLNGPPDRNIELLAPRKEWAIRNPDLFLAGRRVEMVSTPKAMADQIPESGVTAEDVDRVGFFHSFFRSPDRVGYWLHHESPPGEDIVAVARRIITFCTSLLDAPMHRRQRYICVTHSPVMRAVLVYALDDDPGEPEWVECIDLAMDSDGGTLTFRDRTVSLTGREPSFILKPNA